MHRPSKSKPCSSGSEKDPGGSGCCGSGRCAVATVVSVVHRCDCCAGRARLCHCGRSVRRDHCARRARPLGFGIVVVVRRTSFTATAFSAVAHASPERRLVSPSCCLASLSLPQRFWFRPWIRAVLRHSSVDVLWIWTRNPPWRACLQFWLSASATALESASEDLALLGCAACSSKMRGPASSLSVRNAWLPAISRNSATFLPFNSICQTSFCVKMMGTCPRERSFSFW